MKSDSDIRDLCFSDQFDFPAPLPSDPLERARLVDEWRFRFAKFFYKFFYELGAADERARLTPGSLSPDAPDEVEPLL